MRNEKSPILTIKENQNKVQNFPAAWGKKQNMELCRNSCHNVHVSMG
jgi:hypothetical protein